MLALLFGGLLAGAVATELTLRIFDLGPGDAVAFATQPAFERIPGIHHPNQDLIDRSMPALPFRVRINNVGYRGADISAVKPAGQMRILLVGDSFGFGAQVDEDSTLAAHLEQDMRQRCGDVLVMNASLSGSTITEHLPLMLRGLALQPDLVILEVTGNDVEDLLRRPTRWRQLADVRTSRDFGPLAHAYPLLRKLRLWRVARAGVAGVKARQLALQPAASRLEQADSTTDRLRREYLAELHQVTDTLDALDIPLTIALYPRVGRLRRGRSAVAFLKERLIADSVVNVVDLRDGLLASHLPDSQLYLMPEDVHPTGRAHAIAAAQIAASLPCITHAPEGSTR